MPCLSESKQPGHFIPEQNIFHRHEMYNLPDLMNNGICWADAVGQEVSFENILKPSSTYASVYEIRTVMFTPTNFKTLALATNFAWYSGVVPYHFVKTKTTNDLELVCEPSGKRKLFVVSAFSINAFYILFISFRIFQKLVLSDDKASIEFLVKMGYIFSAYLLPVVLQINTLKHWKETSEFIVQYIRFYKKVQG